MTRSAAYYRTRYLVRIVVWSTATIVILGLPSLFTGPF